MGDDLNRSLKLTGAKDALPLWAAFMREADAGRPGEAFARPEGVVELTICADSGMQALSGCPRRKSEQFLSGTEPQRDCALHPGGIAGWLKRLLGKD